MNNRFAGKAAGRSGMTLIELVVVLALLAGLAAMTLTGVGDLGSRARYDETTTRLQLIRQAVVGTGVEAGRFVRDTGRLPVMHSTNDSVRLRELWRDAGGIGYGTTTNTTQWPGSIIGLYPYDAVVLTCGWNGPYLMVNDPATAESYDGFGNPWHVTTNTVGEILTVTSLGSDNASGGTTWDEADHTLDLGALLPETELTVLVKARHSTNVQDAAWSLIEPALAGATNPYQLNVLYVVLFTPDLTASTRAVRQQHLPLMAANVVSAVTFSNLMPTDCKVYAYGTNAVSGLQVSGHEPEIVTLRPGCNTITLYLRKP